MNQKIKDELVSGLVSIYGNKLISIILYGSVVRGSQTQESDVDIAIILKEKNDAFSKDKMLDLLVDMDLKYNKVFSIVDIDYNNYLKWQDILPFYRNVKEEGMILWKAA